MGESKHTPTWSAHHDMLVCAGAKQIQKWCVREGGEKGPLIAVMLTSEVAHLLAAGPELLKVCKALCDIYGGKRENWRVGEIIVENARAAIAKATGVGA